MERVRHVPGTDWPKYAASIVMSLGEALLEKRNIVRKASLNIFWRILGMDLAVSFGWSHRGSHESYRLEAIGLLWRRASGQQVGEADHDTKKPVWEAKVRQAEMTQ